MRTFALIAILLASAACDKDEKSKQLVDSVVGDAAAPTQTSSIRLIDSGSGDAAASSSSLPMPERPIPKPETMVTSGMSVEIQTKAIAYMVAMRAPHADDAAADETFANDLATKLKPILLSIDKGPDKAHWNHVDVIGKGRQVDLMMSDGCDPKTPFNAVAQRANVPLATLLSHGILVLRCNDTKRQCLQSVRDPDDVLCTTAIRHK